MLQPRRQALEQELEVEVDVQRLARKGHRDREPAEDAPGGGHVRELHVDLF